MFGMIELAESHAPLAELLEEQIERVTVVFERQLASDLSAVNELCLHVEHYRGKMLRPLLVLLGGVAGGGKSSADCLNERHRIVAAVVEMIHMATLVHDDVLDEADIRRSGATINRIWGNETAVMLGDYLISNAFHLCSTAGEPEINLALGEVTNTVCEGELIQLHHRHDSSLDEATYLEIVRRKTASLIAESCRLGAWLSGADRSVTEALNRYGEMLGIAFQIQDDLLDLLGEERVVGKTLGRDLDKGKITLPLILYLEEAGPLERGDMLRLVNGADETTLAPLLQQSGAVELAATRAQSLVDRAKDELGQLAPGAARDLLADLADAVVRRAR